MHVSLVLQHQACVKRKESFSTRSTDKTASLQCSLDNVRDVLKWLHSSERAAERLPLELIARYQLAVWERLGSRRACGCRGGMCIPPESGRNTAAPSPSLGEEA